MIHDETQREDWKTWREHWCAVGAISGSLSACNWKGGGKHKNYLEKCPEIFQIDENAKKINKFQPETQESTPEHIIK